MTGVGKVTVPIKKVLIQKMYESLKVRFKKLACTACVLSWIILEKRSVHVLPLYLRCIHKLWKIKQAKYYTQRSAPVNINGCSVQRKKFASLGASRPNGLMWRVELFSDWISESVHKEILSESQ